MPAKTWSAERERQYRHIKDSLRARGESVDEAQEIAARTVNKDRARHGESEQASRESLADIASARRGGLRSHEGPGGPTYRQLYAQARKANLAGRSRMNKDELAQHLARR